jgi:hypothetical protein
VLASLDPAQRHGEHHREPKAHVDLRLALAPDAVTREAKQLVDPRVDQHLPFDHNAPAMAMPKKRLPFDCCQQRN